MSSPPELATPEPDSDLPARPEAEQPLNGDGTTASKKRGYTGTGRRKSAYSLGSLGARIREERKAQGKTLREVADASGISTSFLSQVERDQAKPSVGTLHTIAEALGLTMADLFLAYAEGNRARARTVQSLAQVIRADERKGLVYPHSGIRNELLSPDLGHAIQMMWVTMPPGEGTGNRPLVHEGEECAVVVQGSVEIWVGEGEGQERYVLGPGDSIYQPSTIPHRSRNIGDTDAIIVVAITPPSF